MLLIIIILIILIVLLIKFSIQFGAVNFISGEVKSGKTLFSVYQAIKETNKRRFIVGLQNILLFWKPKQEKPLLYSNIPLKYKYYTPLTAQIIYREARIINKSVVLIDEASLLADNMSFNDNNLNERLTLFIKLFGHYSHGGIMFINSQDLKDVHFGIKRSISNIYFIKKRIKLPFITIFKFCRFMSVIDDNVTLDEKEYNSFIFNNFYKKYDCYTYSSFTDNLNIINKTQKCKTLKSEKLLTFRKYKSIPIDFIEKNREIK